MTSNEIQPPSRCSAFIMIPKMMGAISGPQIYDVCRLGWGHAEREHRSLDREVWWFTGALCGDAYLCIVGETPLSVPIEIFLYCGMPACHEGPCRAVLRSNTGIIIDNRNLRWWGFTPRKGSKGESS